MLWVGTYLMHSCLDCLHDAIDPIQEHGDHKTKAALLVFFGTQSPDYSVLNHFFEVYKDWVDAIADQAGEIALGFITLDEVILDQVTKETWL